MGIVRIVEWRMVVRPDEAQSRLRRALEHLGMDVVAEKGVISGSAARSWRKNRWAADVRIELLPEADGAVAVCRVDMLGNRHYAILSEIAEAVGDDAFDDGGVTAAVEALGKLGRVFGRKEVRHLRHLLHADERVLVLGQGVYDKKQGLIALTDRRLFFFEKSLGSEIVEEFSLKSISSLATSKKIGGERLVIHASGNASEIKQLRPGQADEIARRFRQLSRVREHPATPPAGAAVTSPAEDQLMRLERLAALHERGALSDEEFARLKADILRA
jgi:hypothetical protein